MRTVSTIIRVAALTVLTVLTACGGGAGDVLIEADGLVVTDAWNRPSPPGVDTAAVYVTLGNEDAPHDRLIGASSERCAVMTPHLTRIDDDIASMAEAGADQLGLHRGEEVVMEPNGLHLMCLGLDGRLAEGEPLTVTLEFSEHAPIDTPVSVEQR